MLKVDLTEKNDQIQTQQNNTIIALLMSLHHRITLVKNKIINIERILTGVDKTQNWQ